MNANEVERYTTTIEPIFTFGEDRYEMVTDKSSPAYIRGNPTELKAKLTKDGRLANLVFLGGRILQVQGIMEAVATFVGYPIYVELFSSRQPTDSELLLASYLVWTCGTLVLAKSATERSKWDSRIETFRKTFPNNEIHLIPERFNPRTYFRKFGLIRN
ncbi:hypothetical protein A3F00_03030 [Candidatus Daviesbacteria bacterium RIFCSPHIGHO2_12_FULL_37_11]|uniref:Uncharacterized protein n=1 Tax=Candidatus Daviesbacteria bacterium RIFCSPHIGHO2_12_FULL_37_11 TaxID=1797777 RepID=A0A1F5KBE5_9BACT|nr:MAG: hypothetical protein A2111_03405 [Candidatus Daviesbacteria bacterium GWA1_38_6]OGE16971.1 MAG: hypothetical protein A2769_04320 [Candidatus Daviesbacteria bacterium RIFCSPHIGHO2_01_FULL_37_27]OGE38273.1 MAG: hypothetical protein A3F00_03030 [Candidatus Daviesbacteria bacterium RIFCSPHIGHO2_12_FULL_37_11]OGE46229.1 MAG: hypothetical protein A3B39_02795 [Candidatus Daviesbacteria bacterium RIFCSPLOWO2_01_FULL_37_10]